MLRRVRWGWGGAPALTSGSQLRSAHSCPHRPLPHSPQCPSFSSSLFYLLCIFGVFLLPQSPSSHFTLLLSSAPCSALSVPSKRRDENNRGLRGCSRRRKRADPDSLPSPNPTSGCLTLPTESPLPEKSPSKPPGLLAGGQEPRARRGAGCLGAGRRGLRWVPQLLLTPLGFEAFPGAGSGRPHPAVLLRCSPHWLRQKG